MENLKPIAYITQREGVSMDIDEYIRGLSDEELREAVVTVREDLAEAAADHNGSEWHEACFAAAMIVALEVERRGMVLNVIH